MTKVEISHKTVVFSVLFLIGLYILYLITDIVLGIFIAVMLMTALHPLVKTLVRLKLPRMLAIWLTYVVVLAILGTLVGLIIPPLISQTASLVNNLPLTEVGHFLKDYKLNLQDISTLAAQLSSLPKVLSVLTSTFSFVLTVITLLVMTFYLLIERENLPHHVRWLFGNHKDQQQVENFVNKVEAQIGNWVRGELTLLLVIGVMTYVGLTLLRVPYALPLAILAGILEILPNLGPTISSIPAILVAYFMMSPAMALGVAALYILIQQLENNLIVPQVMRNAVGVNPIITIILLLIGFRLYGVGGAALAIPLFLVAKVVAVEFYRIKQLDEEN